MIYFEFYLLVNDVSFKDYKYRNGIYPYTSIVINFKCDRQKNLLHAYEKSLVQVKASIQITNVFLKILYE